MIELNDKIMEQLLPIVERTKEGIIRGVEIIQEQAPEVVSEVLKWNFTISLIACICGIILAFLAIPIYKTVNKLVDGTVDDGMQLLAGAPLIIGLVVTFVNLNWLKIAIAPKLFLIEYIMNLVK